MTSRNFLTFTSQSVLTILQFLLLSPLTSRQSPSKASMAMAAPIHASSITKISSTKQIYPFTSHYRPSSLVLSHTLSIRSTLRRPMVAAAATTVVEAEPRSNSTAPSKSLPFRVGHGFDLHRLEPGYPLIIGGIDIPHDRGCEAHSDGSFSVLIE